jgi:hypothetical protein
LYLVKRGEVLLPSAKEEKCGSEEWARDVARK